ncbi:MAG: MotA/TolQ/ExbB proton channel family protein [Candidatus Saccharimonas sp.]|nr:MotA/TolQ/ExbB proton channel family protein [Planctomycetaceae bacterium]
MLPLEQHRVPPVWLVLVLLAISAFAFTRPIAVHAQDEPEAGAAAPAADAAALAKPEAHKAKSTLWWIIETSGLIGAFMLLVSIYFVGLVVQLFMELRAPVVAPPELMEKCEALLAKRDFNGIYKVAKDSACELGQLIATGLAALSFGFDHARETIDRQSEEITVGWEKRISMLAVIGTLGPLVGLLGTLKGMIASFSVIALSDTQLKASEVAGGISEALILTFEGVGLSVPAIYFFAVFKNRVSQLSVSTLNVADDFIFRVHTTAQKKAPAPTETAS